MVAARALLCGLRQLLLRGLLQRRALPAGEPLLLRGLRALRPAPGRRRPGTDAARAATTTTTTTTTTTAKAACLAEDLRTGGLPLRHFATGTPTALRHYAEPGSEGREASAEALSRAKAPALLSLGPCLPRQDGPESDASLLVS